MKILKITITLMVLLMLTLYLPVNVKAFTEDNDRIINERKLYNGTINNINESIMPRYSTYTFNNMSFKRSTIISVTRSSTNTGISMFIKPNGHYVEVAIFEAGSSTNVIGTAKIANVGVYSSLNWSNSELGNIKNVDVFITAYSNVDVSLEGSFTY